MTSLSTKVITMLSRAELRAMTSSPSSAPIVKERVRTIDQQQQQRRHFRLPKARSYHEIITLCLPYLPRSVWVLLLGLSRSMHSTIISKLLAKVLVTTTPEAITRAPDLTVISYRLLYKLITAGPLHKVKSLYLYSPPVSQAFIDNLTKLIPQASVVVVGHYDIDNSLVNVDFEVELGQGKVARYLNPQPIRYCLDNDPVSFTVDDLTLCNVEFASIDLTQPVIAPSKLTLMGEIDVDVIKLVDMERVRKLAVYTHLAVALLLAKQLEQLEMLSLCVDDPCRVLRSLPQGSLAHLVVYFPHQQHFPIPAQVETCLSNHSASLNTVTINSNVTKVCSEAWLDVAWKLSSNRDEEWSTKMITAMKQESVKYTKLSLVTIDGVKYRIGRVLGDWVYTNGEC